MRERRLAVVVSGFPRVSETFALNELLALEASGLLGAVFATKPGDTATIGPDCGPLVDRVEILPDVSTAEQAEYVARRLEDSPPLGIHGYFAHEPAQVAYLAAREVGVAHGFSLHARDARKATPEALRARSRSAACVIACNADVAADVARFGVQTQIVPHGVDLRRFHPRPTPRTDVPLLLAVGRLVEKKGFAVLLGAAAFLDVPFRLRIVGEGPERDGLQSLLETSGLGDRVTLCGAMSHADLVNEYAAAHIVVVPSVIDARGDRDGLPNVVLEAMASGRPVVASDVAAIGCAVGHERTGLLVPPADPIALAAALTTLIGNPRLGARLAANARRRVEADFALERCTARLVALLEAAYG